MFTDNTGFFNFNSSSNSINRLNRLRDLIEKAADVNAVNCFRKTLLHHAAQMGSIKMVRDLIAKGANVNAVDHLGWTPLRYAVRRCAIKVSRDLIANGADVNAVDDHDDNSDRSNLLHYAAQRGFIEIVPDLIANGADVNAVDVNGLTPLHYAARYGHIEIVRDLIANGAYVNAVDGLTPLHYAAQGGFIEIARYLIANGVDVNAVDVNGLTPLHYGLTPLHYAARNNRIDTVRCLIASLLNLFNHIPLQHKTIQDSNIDIIRLKEHINDASNNGVTSITSIVNPLLRNKDGRTPRDVATESNVRPDIIELLEDVERYYIVARAYYRVELKQLQLPPKMHIPRDVLLDILDFSNIKELHNCHSALSKSSFTIHTKKPCTSIEKPSASRIFDRTYQADENVRVLS
ncbi:hypothetical protein BIY23_04570 [Wolbachia pipientis]|uniref:Uncharacterized protein n=1 Tax=Wolbachia pipientis TaxID=955 RepID=A0A1E7QK73_WOLPI|nr:ankyrin repeat domain-containing protein [Wolbachia pipientis]OEY86871.1 hypothetical protein BIY23_04570 [Wolbachia pipientis]